MTKLESAAQQAVDVLDDILSGPNEIDYDAVDEVLEALRAALKKPQKRCKYCEEYFTYYRCGIEETGGECDCPKCQGICECLTES